MATGKKSFIAYADWKNTFDELENEDAGALIKHIFAYVNDEEPKSESVLIRAIFANIKATLKRDLDKWDTQLLQRSEAGKRSAELRALNKVNDRSTLVESRARNPTDSVSVSVNDNVIQSNNSLYNRKLKFSTTLIPFLDLYDKDLIRAFCDYWTEHGDKDKKMRFEKEKSFGLSRRLATWNKNNFGNTNNKKEKQYELTQLTNRLRGLD